MASDNNEAVVARLRNIKPIEGADRIVQADVVLNGIKLTQVVVGVGTQEDTLVVYFDSNLALSDNLVKAQPELATYLGKGNRVKAVKLKGIISNGLAVEVEKFSEFLKEGDSFTVLAGVPICSKWIPPVQRGSGGPNDSKKTGKSRLVPDQFHFHTDTDNLLKNIRQVHPDSIISITRKVHGTSAIAGNLLVKEPEVPFVKTWRHKLSEFLTGVIITGTPAGESYDYLYASRNTVKNGYFDKEGMDPREVEAKQQSFEHDLWVRVGKEHFGGKLKKGETVYYEIIGYQGPQGSFVQKNYDYGCKPGEHKALVYRITKTGPDGHVVEYGWQALKERCEDLGAEHVEELYFGKAGDYIIDVLDVSDPYGETWKDYDSEDTTTSLHTWRLALLGQWKADFLEKDCWGNLTKPKIPDEGVVVRIEGLEIQAYKLKSERFVLGESEAKDKGEVDIEDQESAQNT